MGPSWSWSYGSWIFNYLCNQCLSPVKSWFLTPFRWGILDTTLCDKDFQWLATGRWFSTGTLVSSTNKTDCHDITEILLKVALNTINQTKPKLHMFMSLFDRRKYLLKKDVYSLVLYKYFLVGQNLCDINSIFYNNIQCIHLSYHKKWEKKTNCSYGSLKNCRGDLLVYTIWTNCTYSRQTIVV